MLFSVNTICYNSWVVVRVVWLLRLEESFHDVSAKIALSNIGCVSLNFSFPTEACRRFDGGHLNVTIFTY